MKVFAISDLHLSINNPKPMDIFGPVWNDYLDTIIEDWNKKVCDDDIVLMAGDFSWAMKLKDAQPDIDFISKLKGKKIMIRGNHDYWWEAIGKVREALPDNFYAIQNDSLMLDNIIFCGTRGWTFDDEKLKSRELLRLEMSLIDATKRRQNNEPLICMVHYPPFEKNYIPSPVTDLMEKYNVTCVVYGHLHGVNNVKMIVNLHGINYYLTSCDMLKNKLIQIFPEVEH